MTQKIDDEEEMDRFPCPFCEEKVCLNQDAKDKLIGKTLEIMDLLDIFGEDIEDNCPFCDKLLPDIGWEETDILMQKCSDIIDEADEKNAEEEDYGEGDRFGCPYCQSPVQLTKDAQGLLGFVCDDCGSKCQQVPSTTIQ